MIKKEEIDAALNAHAQWKQRLIDAIATGKSEFKPDVVKADNTCQFGKWLYGLTKADTQSEDYSTIKELHAHFHKVAGEILQSALSGKKEEALKRIDYGGDYGTASGKLVLALQRWKSKI